MDWDWVRVIGGALIVFVGLPLVIGWAIWQILRSILRHLELRGYLQALAAQPEQVISVEYVNDWLHRPRETFFCWFYGIDASFTYAPYIEPEDNELSEPLPDSPEPDPEDSAEIGDPLIAEKPVANPPEPETKTAAPLEPEADTPETALEGQPQASKLSAKGKLAQIADALGSTVTLGPNLRTRERYAVFKRLKDAHPIWSQDRVAMEAFAELGEHVNGETVRNAYRAMGDTWVRGDRAR